MSTKTAPKRRPRGPLTPDDPRHGSHSGYSRHLADGSEPCGPCREANNDYHRQYRAQQRASREAERRRAAARQRAFRLLSRLHPEEFRALYDQELNR